MPAFGTDTAHGRIRRHTSSRSHLVIIQITLCGDRCGIFVVRIPQARTDLGIGRLVAQVVGHPDHTVNLYRTIVFALVIQALRYIIRIVVVVIGIDIRTAAGFRTRTAAGLAARFARTARTAAGIFTVIGILHVRTSGVRQFSAIDPIGNLTAQTDLDHQIAVIGNNYRKIITLAAFEQRILDRLCACFTIPERDGNFQSRLLRDQNRPIYRIGSILESLDPGGTCTRTYNGLGNRKVYDGIDGRTTNRNLHHGRSGLVGDLDRKLRHQMVESHADGCTAGNHIPLNRTQQIGRSTSEPLFDRNTECSRGAILGIGIIGRQCG